MEETKPLTIGIIVEGNTDHVVLRNILIGYFRNFSNLDLTVRPLQPSSDSTDAGSTSMSSFGGWYNVFQYCKSDFLLPAFEQNDFIIIQIDSDRSHEMPFEVPMYKTESPETSVERIKKLLQSIISKNFGLETYASYSERIIFAIAVDEIECWLLPLYYENKIQSSTKNCLHRLVEKFRDNSKINPLNKDKRDYDYISKDLSKIKELTKAYPKNPSFKIFMEDLMTKSPVQT